VDGPGWSGYSPGMSDIEAKIENGRLIVSCPWDPAGQPSPKYIQSSGQRGMVNHARVGWTEIQIDGHGIASLNMVVASQRRAVT